MDREDKQKHTDEPVDKLIDFAKYQRRRQGETPQSNINVQKQSDEQTIFPRKYPEPKAGEEIQGEFQRLQNIVTELDEYYQTLNKSENFYPKKSAFQTLSVNYADELNPEQLAAVTYTTGPLLIIAGAGTGKTKTLVYRVSYLIEQAVSPERILLLTFTRKAAKEMQNRVKQLLGTQQGAQVKGGTFHSFATYLLRRYSGLVQISPGFTILDQADSQDVIDLLRSEYGFHQEKRAFPKKERIYELVSKSRNTQSPLQEVIEEEYPGLTSYIEELQTLARAYHKYKRNYDLVDYDDLLILLRDHLRENERFYQKVCSEIDHVLVDEFQDTNVVQREIVDLIGAYTQNITVVGDDFQSIYGFRGANWENILTFPRDYPDARIIKLENNYRSHDAILTFSNKIVENARIGYKKQLYSCSQTGDLPELWYFYSQENEASRIVDEILHQREQNISLSDMAVLYRASSHGNFIQTELIRRQIPYVVYGGIKFMERKHVKDVVAHLRLLQNPFDPVSWNRALKVLPGVGKARASQIVSEVTERQGKLDFTAFQKTQFYSHLVTLREALLDAGQEHKLPAEQVERILEYYTPILKKSENDALERQSDLEVLYQFAQNCTNLTDMLTDLSLDPPANKFQQETAPAVNQSEDERLVLTTIHSAKGLEWRMVFIPHLLDGLFPSSLSLRDSFDLEEERRLFYVAVTRAKEKLYLSLPHEVVTYNGFFTHPSRFLKDISSNCYTFRAYNNDDRER